jgi:hypothetical protein
MSNHIWQNGSCDQGLKEHLYVRSMEADVGRFCSAKLSMKFAYVVDRIVEWLSQVIKWIANFLDHFLGPFSWTLPSLAQISRKTLLSPSTRLQVGPQLNSPPVGVGCLVAWADTELSCTFSSSTTLWRVTRHAETTPAVLAHPENRHNCRCHLDSAATILSLSSRSFDSTHRCGFRGVNGVC